MKIDRHNYEEYFILYTDNELSSEERGAVENFVAENPDLKAELDMLLNTRLLPDEELTFPNKQSLIFRDSKSITMDNYEEWLLCYIDNELTDKEIADVQTFIANNPVVEKELELFRKTKLQPEAIIFTDKESLYRREEKARVVSIRWWKIAAAAVLLIGMSTTALLLLNNDGKQAGDSVPTAKTGNQGEKKPTDTGEQAVREEATESLADNDVQADTGISETENKNPVAQSGIARENNRDSRKQKVVRVEDVLPSPTNLATIEVPKKQDNNLPAPVDNPYFNNKGKEDALIADAGANSTNLLTNNKGNQITSPVTSGSGNTLNPSEADAGVSKTSPDVAFASNDGKNSRLRGFFRKITRNFEKRTNIKATDGEDGDRLLIAGLAIKLN